MKKILKNSGVQAFIASIICIIIGLLVGYIVLLAIEPAGASEGMGDIIKNFLGYNSEKMQLKYFASTLTKTAPLLMCALSILFAYKVGLFNIGAAGQYVVGACAAIYGAIGLGLGWLPCMLLAMIAGMVWAFIVGVLKAYCNVNEVISGIMLNWIGLYLTNVILDSCKAPSTPYTYSLKAQAGKAVLPNVGLDELFGNNYIGIAVILSIILAIVVDIVLNKTKLGYELRATGINKNAAKYAGMKEKKNIILTLVISGALAGLAGSFLYQTDIQQWMVGESAVPGMGFNGIAAAFLGGLNPIGTIFASFFIQHITDGSGQLNLSYYCTQVSDLISAIIIYSCGFVGFMKYAMNARIARKEEAKGGKK